MIRLNVDAEDFVKRLIRQVAHRPIIRVNRRIADQYVDFAQHLARLVHQILKIFFASNMRRDDSRATDFIGQFEGRWEEITRPLRAIAKGGGDDFLARVETCLHETTSRSPFSQNSDGTGD